MKKLFIIALLSSLISVSFATTVYTSTDTIGMAHTTSEKGGKAVHHYEEIDSCKFIFSEDSFTATTENGTELLTSYYGEEVIKTSYYFIIKGEKGSRVLNINDVRLKSSRITLENDDEEIQFLPLNQKDYSPSFGKMKFTNENVLTITKSELDSEGKELSNSKVVLTFKGLDIVNAKYTEINIYGDDVRLECAKFSGFFDGFLDFSKLLEQFE